MLCFDLRQLSSRDFEELTRDLLQAEWNVHQLQPVEQFGGEDKCQRGYDREAGQALGRTPDSVGFSARRGRPFP